jgi:two-component system sensor histidine kinase RpfC
MTMKNMFRESRLLSLSKRLQDKRLERAIGALRESWVSRARVFLYGLCLAWTWPWMTRGPLPMQEQAVAVVLLLGVVFVTSLVWWAAIRKRPDSLVRDAIGIAFDFVVIALVLEKAFILLITLNALLPLVNLRASALFGVRPFYAAVAATTAVMLWSAPDGYWLSRPAYALYAIIVSIGMPLLIHRIFMSLQGIAEVAVEARDSQKRFIAAVSHELRTPINAITNGSLMMDASVLSDRDRELLDLVKGNGQELADRVNLLLDTASLERGSLSLSSVAFGLDDVMGRVRRSVGYVAEGKGVNLLVSIETRLKDKVFEGDVVRVAQVITNLASNAIRATPAAGTVRVVVHGGEAPGELVFAVSDEGRGIAEGDRKRIFEAFVQLGKGSDGVGLGLYIVKSISDQLGGSLEVGRSVSGGALFRWEVTMKEADGPRSHALHGLDLAALLRVHRSTTEPVKVMVVDDSRSNREIFRLVLEQAGHSVRTHETLSEADQVIGEGWADLAIVDAHLGDGRGAEWIAKAKGRGVRIPMVVASADAERETIEQALAAGAIKYLTKPVDFAVLLDTIEGLKDQRKDEAA